MAAAGDGATGCTAAGVAVAVGSTAVGAMTGDTAAAGTGIAAAGGASTEGAMGIEGAIVAGVGEAAREVAADAGTTECVATASEWAAMEEEETAAAGVAEEDVRRGSGCRGGGGAARASTSRARRRVRARRSSMVTAWSAMRRLVSSWRRCSTWTSCSAEVRRSKTAVLKARISVKEGVEEEAVAGAAVGVGWHCSSVCSRSTR